MKNFTGKKGVSPIIATVLLMAFAIALGALVMTWGKNYVEDTTEEVSSRSLTARTCALDVSVEVMNIGGETTLCKTESGGLLQNVQFVLNNRGSPIDDVQVNLIDEDKNILTRKNKLPSPLTQAQAKKITIENVLIPQPSSDPLEFKSLKQIIITPIINLENEAVYCPNKAIEEDIIPICS